MALAHEFISSQQENESIEGSELWAMSSIAALVD
jgi:hypothetical protein